MAKSLTVSNMARQIGCLPTEVNEALVLLGYQEENENRVKNEYYRFVPTAKGEPLSVKRSKANPKYPEQTLAWLTWHTDVFHALQEHIGSPKLKLDRLQVLYDQQQSLIEFLDGRVSALEAILGVEKAA